MKSFDRLREQALEEKLKASDPTGKWISDFVHSDNPKFAGKSKKERIRMALGASYAAKRNEEVDSTDIHERVTMGPDGKPLPTKFSGNTTDSRSPDEEKAHQEAKKDVEDTLRAREADIEKRNTEMRKQGQTREFKLGESAWGKDKMANLKAAHDRHSEKAIAANKAGDDQAAKVHQSKMNMLKTQMNKLRKEEVEQIDELKTSTLIRYGTKATQSANKLNDNPAKRDKREYGINRSIQKVKQRYAKEDVERIDEAKHRVQVTVSEPDHPMVTKRKEHQQKFIRVSGDKENAVTKAQQHYKKQGYKVHGAEYVSSVNEDVVAEESGMIRKVTPVSVIDGPGGYEEAQKRIKDNETSSVKRQELPGSNTPPIENRSRRAEKPKVNTNEQIVREGKIKVNFKMPSEHLSDKLARRQSELRKKSGLPDPAHYKNVSAQKKKELGEGSIEQSGPNDLTGTWSSKTKKGQPDVPPPVPNDPIDKNAKDTTTIKTGLGDLNKVFDQIDKENAAKNAKKKSVKEDADIKVRPRIPGPGTEKQEQGSKKLPSMYDVERANKKEIEGQFNKSGYESPYDKDTRAKDKGSKVVNTLADFESVSFSVFRNKLAEAKKMKGEDPCWDDYKMIGTKMKNGKQVPNCVPKEETEIEGISIQEEDDYPHSGVGVSRDMGMAQTMARMKAQTSLMRSKHGDNYTDQKMIDHDEKTEFAPGDKPGTYRATVRIRERVPAVKEELRIDEAKPGLYANIHAKRKRIEKGSGERMRKPGTKGAPTAQAFKDAAKTAKK